MCDICLLCMSDHFFKLVARGCEFYLFWVLVILFWDVVKQLGNSWILPELALKFGRQPQSRVWSKANYSPLWGKVLLRTQLSAPRIMRLVETGTIPIPM